MNQLFLKVICPQFMGSIAIVGSSIYTRIGSYVSIFGLLPMSPYSSSSLCLQHCLHFAGAAVVEGDRQIHMSQVQDYPQTAPLPLPANINPNETIQFSPQRARDISSNEMHVQTTPMNAVYNIDVTCAEDHHLHLASYDCRGSVNLNCTMQSNVPQPFGGTNFTHLNMPGGQWSQNGKFMSQDLQASHYTNLRQQVRADWNKKGAFRWSFPPGPALKRSFHSLIVASATNLQWHVHGKSAAFSTAPPSPSPVDGKEGNPPVAESKKMKLKQAIKDYGSTVIFFHITISLASLGMFYALVSRYAPLA